MDVTIEEDELRISQNTFNLLRNQFPYFTASSQDGA